MRGGSLRRLLPVVAGAAAAALIGAATPTAAQVGEGDRTCRTRPAAAHERAMITLIARDRRAERVRPVRRNAALTRAGRSKSRVMARGGAFDHSGTLPWAKGRAAGQNIAMASSAADAFEAMLGSAGHRANLRDGRWRLVGVGAARGCDRHVYFTLNFLGPRR